MNKTIGQRIRKLRIERDLNQQQVANLLKITPGAYAKIERGETDPQASRLYELAAIFKTDITALMIDKPDAAAAGHKTELELVFSQLNLLSKELERMRLELADFKRVMTKKKS